jgi:GNAT superfamily N-acetyltransferase
MLSITQVADPIQIAFAQELVREYFSWFFALVPGSETDPTFRGWESELEAIPGACVPPRGSYLLATLNGQPAGCVTLKPVDPDHCELKRLYVRPAFRGHNVGKQLVHAFMQNARGLGYKYAVLDSHRSMATAHDIYRISGFNVVEAPPDFPEDLRQSVIFMRCVL